jgi:lactate permease
VDAAALASTSALTSAPVFIVLAALASYCCGVGISRALVGLGLLFLGVLYASSRWLGPEVAGVSAGLSVAATTLLLALHRRQGATALAWPRKAWPYLALIICIVLLKGLNALTHLEDAWVVRGQHVAWKPLASPGIALLLVLVWVHRRGGGALLGTLGARARRPLLTILFFLAMSQMMVKAGFLDGLVQVLIGLPDSAAAPLVALLGGLSGYMTGSNVGGNAIFMPAVALLPESSRGLLAAVQNSAAGHAALGSLSIVMLVLGLAKTSAEEEGQLVRFGFALACVNTALVALAGWVLLGVY